MFSFLHPRLWCTPPLTSSGALPTPAPLHLQVLGFRDLSRVSLELSSVGGIKLSPNLTGRQGPTHGTGF